MYIIKGEALGEWRKKGKKVLSSFTLHLAVVLLLILQDNDKCAAARPGEGCCRASDPIAVLDVFERVVETIERSISTAHACSA